MTKDRRKQASDESYRNASVAQPDSEHLAFNQTCAGSNPAGGTESQLQLVQPTVTEEQRMFQQWFEGAYEEVVSRSREALRVPKRFLVGGSPTVHQARVALGLWRN